MRDVQGIKYMYLEEVVWVNLCLSYGMFLCNSILWITENWLTAGSCYFPDQAMCGAHAVRCCDMLISWLDDLKITGTPCLLGNQFSINYKSQPSNWYGYPKFISWYPSFQVTKFLIKRLCYKSYCYALMWYFQDISWPMGMLIWKKIRAKFTLFTAQQPKWEWQGGSHRWLLYPEPGL